MRELEFLPAWYPQLRERKRLVRLQAYMTVLLAAGLCSWVNLVHRNIGVKETQLADVDGRLKQSRAELAQFNEQTRQKNQLLLQRRIADRLGLPVDMSHLLSLLDQELPPHVCLVDCTFETIEQAKAVTTLAAARVNSHSDGIDRRLQVRLQGVAPSDTDVANFLTGLTNVSFFDQVSMTYSRDRAQEGRILREFEVTFTLELNQSGDQAADPSARSDS